MQVHILTVRLQSGPGTSCDSQNLPQDVKFVNIKSKKASES